MLDINKLSKEVHQNAVDKGFYEEPFDEDRTACLIIEEIGELISVHRKNKWANVSRETFKDYEKQVKGTVEEKLADIIIRLLDVVGCFGFEYDNDSTISKLSKLKINLKDDSMFEILRVLTEISFSASGLIYNILTALCLAKYLSIDIEYHIELKMNYNKTREYKHGNKNY